MPAIQAKGKIIMAEIDDSNYDFETYTLQQYLRDNPAVIEAFNEKYMPLIMQIQDAFNDMYKADDLPGRMLLSTAMFEILQHVQKEQKAFIAHERQKRGYFAVQSAGKC